MLTGDWQPQKNTSLPLYRQIYLHIRRLISSGQLPSGTRLPPQRELAAHYNVNRSTLHLAIDELISDGLLSSRIGSGVSVSGGSWSEYGQPPPVNWHNYLTSGTHLSNLPLIQEINQREFDPNIIRLGTGELSPELLPTAELQHLMAEFSLRREALSYGEPKGLLSLRRVLSRRLADHGIEAAPESILIVSGALQALHLIFFGLLPPNAAVLAEQPSYILSLKMFQTTQQRFTGLPIDTDGLIPQALAAQLTKQRYSLLYTIPTLHNPTGTIMTLDRRRQLLELAERFSLPILEDTAYNELCFTPPPPPLKALDKRGNVLYIGSLSKTSAPGLRIGWLVGPEPVINRLADLKMQNDYGSSCLSQLVAAEWLQQNMDKSQLQSLRRQLKARQKLTDDILRAEFSAIASWQLPQGGFYIWLTLNRPLSLPRLFQRALAKRLLINPGCLYDSRSNRHIRLSYAYAPPAELAAALKQLARIIITMYNDSDNV